MKPTHQPIVLFQPNYELDPQQPNQVWRRHYHFDFGDGGTVMTEVFTLDSDEIGIEETHGDGPTVGVILTRQELKEIAARIEVAERLAGHAPRQGTRKAKTARAR